MRKQSSIDVPQATLKDLAEFTRMFDPLGHLNNGEQNRAGHQGDPDARQHLPLERLDQGQPLRLLRVGHPEHPHADVMEEGKREIDGQLLVSGDQNRSHDQV